MSPYPYWLTGTLTTHYSPHTRAVKERFTSIVNHTAKKQGRALTIAVCILCILSGSVFGCTMTEPTTQTHPDTITSDTAEPIQNIGLPIETDETAAETAGIVGSDMVEGYTVTKDTSGLVEDGWSVGYDFYSDMYPGISYSFAIRLPELTINTSGAASFNESLKNTYQTRYGEHINTLEQYPSAAYNYTLDISYTALRFGDILILWMKNSGGLLGTGGMHLVYDVRYFDMAADRELTHGEFLLYYTKEGARDVTVHRDAAGGMVLSGIPAPMELDTLLTALNRMDAVTNMGAISLTDTDIYGIIPTENGSFYVLYQGFVVEPVYASGAYVENYTVRNQLNYLEVTDLYIRTTDRERTVAEWVDAMSWMQNRFDEYSTARHWADYTYDLANMQPVYRGEKELVAEVNMETWVNDVFLAKSGEEQEALPTLYQAVHALGIAKETFLAWMEARRGVGEEMLLTDAEIEALYLSGEDLYRTLAHPLALYKEGKIYLWQDVCKAVTTGEMVLSGAEWEAYLDRVMVYGGQYGLTVPGETVERENG